MNLPSALPIQSTVLLYLILIWSFIWKGIALWRAVKLDQRNWFIAMLILNTVGVLEILYLFYFAKKKMKLNELFFWKKT